MIRRRHPAADVKDQYREFDGRPSVDLFEDDPLLVRLKAEHGESRADIYPGLQQRSENDASLSSQISQD